MAHAQQRGNVVELNGDATVNNSGSFSTNFDGLVSTAGGVSLFIPRDGHTDENKPAESKFGTTATQTATADASGPAAGKEEPATTASTGRATTRPKTP